MKLSFDKSRYTKKGWVLKLVKGLGAGYIKGFTIFIAYNSGSLRWAINYRNGQLSTMHNFIDYTRIGKLEIGFTHNANCVPYAGE
jgi:hypothetical protein